MTVSLGEPCALHHMKMGEDHGKNHSLLLLPLGKDSALKVVELLVTFLVDRCLLNRFDTRSAFPEAGALSRAAQPSRRDAERSEAPLTGWPEGRYLLREKRFSPGGG
jgi:hypothetical protein